MKKLRYTVVVIILILAFYTSGIFTYSKIKDLPILDPVTESSESPQSSPSVKGSTNYYKVVKILDGDTIDVEMNGEIERIRLIGVDTPETVDPRTQIECFGNEAFQKMRELVDGKRVSLEEDFTQMAKDRYGRLLRYVFLEDGTHVNELIIKEGFGYEYTYDKAYAYQDPFRRSQKFAEENKLGLWADGVCL